jgi:hypothetical protein
MTERTCTNSKPEIIGILSTLGWCLFLAMVVSGLILFLGDGTELLGGAVIAGGIINVSIFVGFSTIIDLLHRINLNTSQSDKAN